MKRFIDGRSRNLKRRDKSEDKRAPDGERESKRAHRQINFDVGDMRKTSRTVNAAIVKILRDPAVSGPLEANGFEVVASSPAEFGARLKADIAKFDEIVRRSGAKVD